MQTTNLPKKIVEVKESINETNSIAENFNKYFTQIGPNLAKYIGTSTKSFISVNEFKDTFFLFKNK